MKISEIMVYVLFYKNVMARMNKEPTLDGFCDWLHKVYGERACDQ